MKKSVDTESDPISKKTSQTNKKKPPQEIDSSQKTSSDSSFNEQNTPIEDSQVQEIQPITFEDLSQNLQEACKRAGWDKLMPVQCHSIPHIMAGHDIMLQSRTGSGKTGAYLLPALTKLQEKQKETKILILVPTRELALQVEAEAKKLVGDNDIDVIALYGGVGYKKQLDALQNNVQIVVGTPGRVLDHLLRRTLSLENLKFLVFDEADRMLSIGFYPDMKEIQRYLPKRPILVSLFSATYPPHVLKLSKEFLRDPHMISLSQGEVHVATSQHFYCECNPMDKDRTLIRILEMENPASGIIFCNTKANVHYVTSVLQGFGYNADELSADLSQVRREDVLTRLRNGEIRFLVATDVAARGIDIPALSHVFIYEPPEDKESYIHRAGRTGRAGAAGTVISLVDIMQKLEMERIAKSYKIDLQLMKTPTDTDVAKIIGERMTTILEAKRRKSTGLELERAKRFLPLITDLIQNNDTDKNEQLLLLALILDGDYQNSLKENISTKLSTKNTNDSSHDKKPKKKNYSKHTPKEA